ncbi:winged helix-turn-helix transcriptional regulator [Ligilactobacillus faecis]|uniref:Winged helix-turn-helix transcriptional regulator n=1 Tax=Ligilactobacillus faecis TaxID=762833 RepID=A0ABV4DP70_9LACO
MRKTEYSLTELGNSIVSIVVALCDWGEQYLDNLKTYQLHCAQYKKR